MDQTIKFEQITTKTGDRGDSSLYNGERRRKDDIVFHLLGNIDELNSSLGLCRAGDHSLDDTLIPIQQLLFRLGSMVATPFGDKRYETLKNVTEQDIHELEAQEKAVMDRTVMKPLFVPSGGNEISARLDVARCVCRRCERLMVTFIEDHDNTHLIPCRIYLNRLSDYIYVLARNKE